MHLTHMYCLYCQTQRAEQIAKYIENRYRGICTIRVISPKIVQRCWVKGREELRTHNYLPGYLFIYADVPMQHFAMILRATGVYRILGQREAGYELVGTDRSFAQMIYDMDGTIGIMQTVQVGDRVALDKALYRDFTGEIIKLDRRKGRALVCFEFDGSTQKIWVGYDMVEQSDGADAKAGRSQ